MFAPFVWFHHNGEKLNETAAFLQSLLAWQVSEGSGGMCLLAAGAGPFAAFGAEQERYGERDEWIPFVQSSSRR